MKAFFLAQKQHTFRNIAFLLFLEMGFLSFLRGTLGAYLNPIALIFVAFLMGILLINSKPKPSHKGQEGLFKLKNVLLGIVSVGLMYEELRKIFFANDYNDISKSDIIPQIQIMVNRLLNGEFPYQIMDFGYELFSPYMPLHWIPFLIPKVLGFDFRWLSGIVFIFAMIPYALWVAKKDIHRNRRILLLFAPTFPIWLFIFFQSYHLAFTVEWLIAAYYLILALSVLSNSTIFRAIGLILCLLSRYSILFWLPFYLLSIFLYEDKKKAIYLSLITGVAIVGLYVVPFLMQDNQLLIKGLAHHNKVTLETWERVDKEDKVPILTYGVGMGNVFVKISGISTEKKIHYLQITQLLLLFSFLIAAFLYYQKNKENIPLPYFLLASLKIYLAIFLVFNQLPYIYYFLPALMLSVVIFAEVWGNEGEKQLDI